jgi:hypothetical protein
MREKLRLHSETLRVLSESEARQVVGGESENTFCPGVCATFDPTCDYIQTCQPTCAETCGDTCDQSCGDSCQTNCCQEDTDEGCGGDSFGVCSYITCPCPSDNCG